MALALILTLAVLPCAIAATAETGISLFSNPEINAMVDENYEKVKAEGWAELRIPQSLHSITEDMFSPNAMDVAHRLIDAGFEARIIGGAIRDMAMGTETMDFDVVTNATIDQQLELMNEMTFHTIQSGLAFGFVHYPDEIIDLAQCVIYPAAFENVDAGTYDDYMTAAADWTDAWTGEGKLLSDDFAMAAILWPAVKGAEDIEARTAEVIAAENQVYGIDDDMTARYTAIYTIQAALEQDEACEDAEGLMASPYFEDAYELLLVRAKTEDGLEEAAEYWTGLRQ